MWPRAFFGKVEGAVKNDPSKEDSAATEEELDAHDRRLLQALAQGEERALETLYVRFRSPVLTALRRHGGVPPDELEDLCQDVFLALRDQAAAFRYASTVRAFIVGIAVKKGWKLRFRKALHSRLIDRVFGREERTGTWHGAVEAVHDAERLLARLPEPQRTVLLLHRVEHLSAEEIASSLGISVNTVWTRLHRARERLREIQAEEAP